MVKQPKLNKKWRVIQIKISRSAKIYINKSKRAIHPRALNLLNYLQADIYTLRKIIQFISNEADKLDFTGTKLF